MRKNPLKHRERDKDEHPELTRMLGDLSEHNYNIETFKESLIESTLSKGSTFKRWFGKSQVTDLSGMPKIVFHGTPDARFLLEEGYFRGLSRGQIFFFSESYDVASSYALDSRAMDFQNSIPAIIPAFLKIKNPYHIYARNKHWMRTQERIQEAYDLNHDGVIIHDTVDYYNNNKNSKSTTVYVVFDSKQIKLADGRKTTYGWSEDIRR